MAKTQKQTMHAKVVRDMKSLNVYKKEYDQLISIYVDQIMQYEKALLEFVEGGYKYETETGAGGTKKSAIVATLENLRKDILAYSDRLCLNPKSMDRVSAEPLTKSILAEALKSI